MAGHFDYAAELELATAGLDLDDGGGDVDFHNFGKRVPSVPLPFPGGEATPNPTAVRRSSIGELTEKETIPALPTAASFPPPPRSNSSEHGDSLKSSINQPRRAVPPGGR